MCTVSLATCSTTADCGALGGTCFDRTTGNLYKGVLSADLQYLGTDENNYRGRYENTTDVLSAEILPGEYVDDLAVLGGTTTT